MAKQTEREKQERREFRFFLFFTMPVMLLFIAVWHYAFYAYAVRERQKAAERAELTSLVIEARVNSNASVTLAIPPVTGIN